MKPNWPAPKNVFSYTTTRFCGIDELQLPSEPVWLNQTHSAAVISLDSTITHYPPTADAAITREPNRICVVRTADCLPILITNQTGTCVASIHAGWRGLLAGVIDNTIAALHVPGDSLLAWLGPAICQQHFEVGPEVRAAYLNRDERCHVAFKPHKTHEHKWLANLYQLASLTLNHLGISNIFGGGFCTYQDTDPAGQFRFYSYRRDQGVTGRMATLIYFG